MNFLNQHPYRCRLEWGYDGARRAAQHSDVVVVVDTLSFSTAVTYAVSRDGIIYPSTQTEDAIKRAKELGASVSVSRSVARTTGEYCLSPSSFDKLQPGERVVLISPNGATCSRLCSTAKHVLAGTLINATAVARVVSRLLDDSDLCVTVLACGEREKEPPHDLRPAIEDYLGAGAILSQLPFDKSPEAEICAKTYQGCADHLKELIVDSVSGREFEGSGYSADIDFAARFDVFDVVPELVNGAYVKSQLLR